MRAALGVVAVLTVAACRPVGPAATASATAGAAAGEWSCGALHGAPTLTRRMGRRNGALVLGVVADTNGVTPATMANLERFAGVFAQMRVDAIAALGDLGGSEDEIARVLEVLGRAGVPVLALAGERERENDFHSAVRRLRSQGADIVDLVDKRLIDTGNIDIVSVPGYPFSHDGCRYTAADLRALVPWVRARSRPLVLLAHTPPKGDGPNAQDWAIGDVNAGDPAMLDLLNAVYPNAALFAHVDEAGGREHRGWINVGGVERGMASVVEIVDGIARPRVLQ